jgi:hypothetical protein
MSGRMSGRKPQRIVALSAAALLAVTAASARADDLPGQWGGHGISFSYPAAWQHIAGQFQYQSGTALWTEFFAPIPPPTAPPADPTQPAPATTPTPDQVTDLVAVAAYRLPISITKKNLPKYKPLIQMTIVQLATRAGGHVTTAPTRITMGKLPGYRFEVAVPTQAGAILSSRIVLVFKKKIEYFVNCQYVQDGPLAAEVTSGCDQVMQSFHV